MIVYHKHHWTPRCAIVYPLEQCWGVRDFRCQWRAMLHSLTPPGLIPNWPSDRSGCLILRDAKHFVILLLFHYPRHLVTVWDLALFVTTKDIRCEAFTIMRHVAWVGHCGILYRYISHMRYLLSLPESMMNLSLDLRRSIWGLIWKFKDP